MPPLLLAAALVGFSPGDPVRLAVSPAAAPTPALKYQLLPEVRELNAGNPVQWYARCFAEQRNLFFNKNVIEERARYRTEPLSVLAARKLGNYGGSALAQADYGARLETPDWQVLDRLKGEGADLSQPELGPFRMLAVVMQTRLRIEVAERRYADAVRSAKTMFAFARHLGEHPTTAANRLGLDVAQLTLDTLEEMAQQPDAPNLYWALADLPSPLVDVRKGVQGDRALADAELRTLRDDVPMSDEQVDELVGRLTGRLGYAREQAGKPPRSLRGELKARLGDTERIATARNRLLEAARAEVKGYDVRPVMRVMGFPPAQVLLLDEKRLFEVRRDDELKRLGLPLWQAATLPAPAGAPGLFAELLPNVSDVRRAQGRVEQRIALLRHVEALRLHAAAHGGKMPASLDTAGVPLPSDPFTGKPFGYEVTGGTARVSGADRRYEVAIRK
jgi:hypothetical protein